MTRSGLSILCIPFLVVAVLLPALAQNQSFTEWPIPTANSLPLHITAVNTSSFYFTESNKDTVGFLNTAVTTNQFTEWSLPGGGLPHGIVYSSGAPVFCAFGSNYVGILNPSTSQLTEWPVPTPNSGPIHLDVAGSGSFFFTEANGNNIGLLNTTSAQITEWPIPTASSVPRGIVVGQGTQVFFVELTTQKIGMLDTSTNTFTEWTLPLHFSQVEHVRFYQGLVIFGDLASSWLGALNPATNVLESGQAPTANAAIPDIFMYSGMLNFTERTANKVGLFNPAHQNIQMQNLTPVVNQVVPTVTSVQAQTVGLSPVQTTVKAVNTNASGVVTGPFTEWKVPTTGGGPMGINVVGNTIVFTEYYGNKIATLSPAQ